MAGADGVGAARLGLRRRADGRRGGLLPVGDGGRRRQRPEGRVRPVRRAADRCHRHLRPVPVRCRWARIATGGYVWLGAAVEPGTRGPWRRPGAADRRGRGDDADGGHGRRGPAGADPGLRPCRPSCCPAELERRSPSLPQATVSRTPQDAEPLTVCAYRARRSGSASADVRSARWTPCGSTAWPPRLRSEAARTRPPVRVARRRLRVGRCSGSSWPDSVGRSVQRDHRAPGGAGCPDVAARRGTALVLDDPSSWSRGRPAGSPRSSTGRPAARAR